MGEVQLSLTKGLVSDRWVTRDLEPTYLTKRRQIQSNCFRVFDSTQLDYCWHKRHQLINFQWVGQGTKIAISETSKRPEIDT